MPVPDFSPGEVLTASAMDSIGLWKVASGSLSLTTSYSNVTGVFGANYRKYRVIFNVTARSTTNRVDMRYLVGTSPIASNYYQGGIGGDWSANNPVYYQRSNNDLQFFGLSGNNVLSIAIDIFNAQNAAFTGHVGTAVSGDTSYGYTIGGAQNSTSLVTGFQLATSTGTATVEYQVFGYRD
jgi:hypothetical protein